MKTSSGQKILIGCSGIGFVALLIVGVIGLFAVRALNSVSNHMSGGYVVSGGKVNYYTGLSGFGAPQSREIEEADAATFAALDDRYAKDKNNAYFEGRIIPQSSGATFEVVRNPYAKDGNHVFYRWQVISDVPTNFKFILPNDAKGTFSTDGEEVFYEADYQIKALFPGTLDAATFERIGSTNYFRDKNHVYTVEKLLEGADPKTFEAVRDNGIYAKDKTGVFYNGVKVADCDVRTHKILNGGFHRDARRVFFNADKISDDAGNFQTLTAFYSKDGKNAFWKTDKISTDGANFKAFPSGVGTGYAKDGTTVYWMGNKLDNADAASFVGLNANYGKDKNTVWYGNGFNEQPSIVENADAATFELDSNGGYEAMDKNHGFYEGRKRGPRK